MSSALSRGRYQPGALPCPSSRRRPELAALVGCRGLSSLGRCEAHVLATVQSVRTALDGTEPQPGPRAESFEAGRSALDHNTDALFGPRRREG